ncbi:hypothetical protein OF897_10530 [Chryseobacterium formosus]|uniref:Immunity protein 26 of polymorphic toxin system n=1 Tax=Chryseobacterium formosus TaxID=1537363 RepID=A0ABT3XQE7_9FLAO|nr:hypothetical protein [Chryseobacterium formosus]MCX8524344.1 hypothetical protein [Chryseobacterium formosus]
MAKRIATKIGDVFSVQISETEKRYMQLIAIDLTQLNSDVIRAFKKKYSINDKPKLEEIVKDEVFFYAHCVTKFGIKLNLWTQIGNIEDVGDIRLPLFRGSRDSGKKINNEVIKVSENWYVWRINDENFTPVGKLEGNNKKADLGLVVNPYDIVDRMKTGQYNFFYPSFE